MCILPNFVAQNLEEFRRKRKKEPEKAEAHTVEIVLPEQPLLENTI